MSETAHFDPVIHPPNRLQICAMLAAVSSAEFAAVRDGVGVSDSVLSKHVRQLEEAGYVKIEKATVASRVRTWLKLTPEGRRAFAAHLAALERLVAEAGAAAGR
ncbi:transcriptional regulator [Caulobacter sp. 17J65-9]|uniref:winged helix-turn-helix domain-containing protein n=1 Tax=Caulobacter sp. 17J65-9 TaxID=2709382 RepID=UPI0013C97D3E|nr:transcriptional regulator [Caulobacter sp. 17J65-9]NEX94560.1 helix-turn-helix domain-containing protein [Caulobacter sp. 17J65-9]